MKLINNKEDFAELIIEEGWFILLLFLGIFSIASFSLLLFLFFKWFMLRRKDKGEAEVALKSLIIPLFVISLITGIITGVIMLYIF